MNHYRKIIAALHKPDYIYKRPDYNKEDIEYAGKQWGHLKRPGRTGVRKTENISTASTVLKKYFRPGVKVCY